MDDQIQKLAAAAAMGRALAKTALAKEFATRALQRGQSVAGFASKYTGKVPGIKRAMSVSDYVAPVAKV